MKECAVQFGKGKNRIESNRDNSAEKEWAVRIDERSKFRYSFRFRCSCVLCGPCSGGVLAVVTAPRCRGSLAGMVCAENKKKGREIPVR